MSPLPVANGWDDWLRQSRPRAGTRDLAGCCSERSRENGASSPFVQESIARLVWACRRVAVCFILPHSAAPAIRRISLTALEITVYGNWWSPSHNREVGACNYLRLNVLRMTSRSTELGGQAAYGQTSSMSAGRDTPIHARGTPTLETGVSDPLRGSAPSIPTWDLPANGWGVGLAGGGAILARTRKPTAGRAGESWSTHAISSIRTRSRERRRRSRTHPRRHRR